MSERVIVILRYLFYPILRPLRIYNVKHSEYKRTKSDWFSKKESLLDQYKNIPKERKSAFDDLIAKGDNPEVVFKTSVQTYLSPSSLKEHERLFNINEKLNEKRFVLNEIHDSLDIDDEVEKLAGK